MLCKHYFLNFKENYCAQWLKHYTGIFIIKGVTIRLLYNG